MHSEVLDKGLGGGRCYKMKIAQVTGFFWPKKYGSNELFLCRELTRRGHEVTVFTTATPSNEYMTLVGRVPRKRIEFHEGFVIKRFPSVLRIGNVSLMPTLLPSLLKKKFDLIHVHEFLSPYSFYSAVVSKVKDIPLLLTQHNDQLPYSHMRKILYYINGYTSGQYVLRQARKIIALSRTIKSHLFLFRVGEDKIEVIPNSVDTEIFAPGKKNQLDEVWGISPPVVLFVGRFIEQKGIRYLLQGFKNIIKELPDVKLVLIGGGPEVKELRRFQSECKNHIFCIDFVAHELMPYIYAGCDVVVLPSLEERFGNVVLEAMASGKPVIGTFIGGMKDTIVHGKTGYHVQPKNSKEIANSLLTILSDETLKNKLGENARRRAVENYSHKVLIKRIEKLYLEAMF